MILSQSLPLSKTFFAVAALATLPAHAARFVTRFLLAAILDGPRLSAAAIGAAVRTDTRHRGNVLRFLRRLPAHLLDDVVEALFGNLLLDGPAQGTWVFIVDQTYCGHNSSRMENGYSTSPRGKRKQASRHKPRRKHKQPHSYCHCFVCGLLLTPSGVRLPAYRSYYTEGYCAQRGWAYRKQTDLAAELIEQLRVPDQAQVVVLGDAAFDAAPVLAACQKRHFGWIVTMNHDRVLAQAKPRPRVSSLATRWTAQDYTPVRLTPGQGPYVAQRRAAACRVGLTRKARHFWVHAETLDVQNVGTCVVLFSTMKPVQVGQSVQVQKVLLSSEVERSVEDLIELYDLRWQIELFFKECKGVLGLDRYQLGNFAAVEGWVSLCLLAFTYLEWYRLQMLAQSRGHPAEQKRWRWQRCHGLAQAVRQDVQEQDLHTLAELLQSRKGIEDLKQRLRRAVPQEYRKAG
jgi:hypothetical protein